jgi:hypothetical protein
LALTVLLYGCIFVCRLRYDLFAGAVVADDLWTLSPFEQRYVQLVGVAGRQLEAALRLLNSEDDGNKRRSAPLPTSTHTTTRYSKISPVSAGELPHYVASSSPQQDMMYDVLATEWDGWALAAALGEVTQAEDPAPVPLPYGPASLNCTSLWFSWVEDFLSAPPC